jgi:hypothetical protein
MGCRTRSKNTQRDEAVSTTGGATKLAGLRDMSSSSLENVDRGEPTEICTEDQIFSHEDLGFGFALNHEPRCVVCRHCKNTV